MSYPGPVSSWVPNASFICTSWWKLNGASGTASAVVAEPPVPGATLVSTR